MLYINKTCLVNLAPYAVTALGIFLAEIELERSVVLCVHFDEILILLTIIICILSTFWVLKKGIYVFFAAANVAKRYVKEALDELWLFMPL